MTTLRRRAAAAALLAAASAIPVAAARAQPDDRRFVVVTDFAARTTTSRSCEGGLENGVVQEMTSDLRERRSRYRSCSRLAGGGSLTLRLRSGARLDCDAARLISIYTDGRVFECRLAAPVTVDFGAGPTRCTGKVWIYGDGVLQACDGEPVHGKAR